MNKIIDFLFQNLYNIFDLITPVCYCNDGFNVIRKTFGTPGRIYNKSGLCVKLPVFQSFDKVNMKLQVHFLNAHSVKSKNDKIIPYNITLDAQVEFRIIDPLIIYKIDIFDDGSREPIRIYVDNEVHLLINSFIDCDISPIEAQRIINEKLKTRNENPINYFQRAIKIERIILSAFDYNLSIRHAQ